MSIAARLKRIEQQTFPPPPGRRYRAWLAQRADAELMEVETFVEAMSGGATEQAEAMLLLVPPPWYLSLCAWNQAHP